MLITESKVRNTLKSIQLDNDLVLTDSGVLMRQPVAAIRTIGRVTQGVKLVKLDIGTTISSITRVISEEDPISEKKEVDVDTKEKTNS